MHVLHILEATQGGTRRHVLDLLPDLQKRGVKCDLIYSPARNPNFEADAARLRAQGVRTFVISMARGLNPASDAHALKRLHRHLRAHSYDAIHCHSTKAGLLGRLSLLGMRRRPPLIYTPHCIAFDTGLPARIRRPARWMETLLAPLTQHFIAVSQHEKRVLLRARLCNSARVSTIHNGLNLEEFDALSGQQSAISGQFTIGCFGRLTRQKNQALLLRALPLVRRDVPGARLLLVGGGEDEPMLRGLAARLGVAECIEWTGDVEEARPLYARCDVVAQPSRWEGCPYSILEAMAARKVVIARSVGGVAEILGDNWGVAYGSKQASVEGLAWWLIETARDERWRAVTEVAARRRVEEAFQLAGMVEKTVAVYDAACS